MAGPLSGIGAQQTSFTQFQPGGTDSQQQARQRQEAQRPVTQDNGQSQQPQGTQQASQTQASNDTQNAGAQQQQTTNEARVSEASAERSNERGSIIDIEV